MSDVITVDIDSKDAQEYVEVFQKRRSAIADEIERLEIQLESLKAKYSSLESIIAKLNNGQKLSNGFSIVGRPKESQSGAEPLKSKMEYDAELTWWEKIQYVLKQENDFLTKNQILEKIMLLEPYLGSKSAKEKRKDSVSIMASLSTKAAQKKLIKIPGGKEFKYGLPDVKDEKSNVNDIIKTKGPNLAL